MPNEKLCTIVCDASFYSDKNIRIGGWAVWIVCENVRYRHWGVFKDPFGPKEGSAQAELRAAINGLSLAKHYFPDVDRFHLVPDCKAIIAQIEQEKGKWWEIMKNIVGDAEITAKHVRAHRNDGTTRSWVNAWCNRFAKRAMRRLRKYGCTCRDCAAKLGRCPGKPDNCGGPFPYQGTRQKPNNQGGTIYEDY
jgi:ribonuclease HI